MRAKSLILLLLLSLIPAFSYPTGLNYRRLVYTEPPPNIKPREVHCLTRNIYFEAATQDERGKFGVALVVLNRVQSKKFPNTICGVIHQGPLDGKSKHLCQFSWRCDGKVDKIRSKRVFAECRRIALLALFHKDRDITGGATHYHATYVNPRWAKYLEKTIQLGDHIFYREKS